MDNQVLGIHHITAIAGDAKRNFDFYTQILGQRFVKKTVNFDDPATYHFYFGDEVGTPGTILTFFPWQGVAKGRQGAGMATEIAYAVPEGSLSFWTERLRRFGIPVISTGQRFGESYLSFEDPDGLPITLVIPAKPDTRKSWTTTEINSDVATRGFHGITLTLRSVSETARVLTDIFDYKLEKQELNRFRYTTEAIETASVVDLLELQNASRAVNAGGTIHHVAFRVKNEDVLMHYREKVIKFGLNITPKIDRNYFYSLYFREPGGVLFELATDNPGFAVDEPVSELGTHLMLPPQYESSRTEIEKVLPSLT